MVKGIKGIKGLKGVKGSKLRFEFLSYINTSKFFSFRKGYIRLGRIIINF